MKIADSNRNFRGRAFTLIEIMIVVAIMGLVAAMGVPSILQSLQKEGMRKAIGDVQDVLDNARTQAILKGQNASVTFHPVDRHLESSGGKSATLPNGVEFAMLDINQLDFGGADSATVRFFPNGTCDEMVLVLHSSDQWRKISLEYSTSLSSATAVDK
ncbi:MAG: prepilin-type N-terminal cleavage/methylation domain-containing protein [Limisphaerales bacterium]